MNHAAKLLLFTLFASSACFAIALLCHRQPCAESVEVLAGDDSESVRAASCAGGKMSVDVVEGKLLARCECGGFR